MKDYLFVRFYLGHDAGEEARSLLRECELLEAAENDRKNRHAWFGDFHTGISLTLPHQDERILLLLRLLGERGIEPITRLERVHTSRELNAAKYLMIRVATAGLWGGVDYGQAYDFSEACGECGADAAPLNPPKIDLGKIGKKQMDHLVYEGHLIATKWVVDGLQGLTGWLPMQVCTKGGRPNDEFSWLKITSTLPRMQSGTSGYVTEGSCEKCGRSGHYVDSTRPEIPRYGSVDGFADFNLTWEYFGSWRQRRHHTHLRTIGGSRGIVISQRARKRLLELKVGRLHWIPVYAGDQNSSVSMD